MSDWRQWLDELQERIQLMVRESERCGCIEARLMAQEHNLPRLIEGYLLLAEAVEDYEECIQFLQEWLPPGIARHTVMGVFNIRPEKRQAALDHLRGVGRD